MPDVTRETLRQAILLLDCALPYFEKQAEAEVVRESTSCGLREITCRKRLEAVKRMIEVVGPDVGYLE